VSDYKGAVCKGAFALGSACGYCERCKEEIQKAKPGFIDWKAAHLADAARIRELEGKVESLKDALQVYADKYGREAIAYDSLRADTEAKLKDYRAHFSRLETAELIALAAQDELRAELESARKARQIAEDALVKLVQPGGAVEKAMDRFWRKRYELIAAELTSVRDALRAWAYLPCHHSCAKCLELHLIAQCRATVLLGPPVPPPAEPVRQSPHGETERPPEVGGAKKGHSE
jgi:hypothetical protein